MSGVTVLDVESPVSSQRVVETCSADLAQQLTHSLRQSMGRLLQAYEQALHDLSQAYYRGAWKALGYTDFATYVQVECSAELLEREGVEVAQIAHAFIADTSHGLSPALVAQAFGLNPHTLKNAVARKREALNQDAAAQRLQRLEGDPDRFAEELDRLVLLAARQAGLAAQGQKLSVQDAALLTGSALSTASEDLSFLRANSWQVPGRPQPAQPAPTQPTPSAGRPLPGSFGGRGGGLTGGVGGGSVRAAGGGPAPAGSAVSAGGVVSGLDAGAGAGVGAGAGASPADFEAEFGVDAEAEGGVERGVEVRAREALESFSWLAELLAEKVQVAVDQVRVGENVDVFFLADLAAVGAKGLVRAADGLREVLHGLGVDPAASGVDAGEVSVVWREDRPAQVARARSWWTQHRFHPNRPSVVALAEHSKVEVDRVRQAIALVDGLAESRRVPALGAVTRPTRDMAETYGPQVVGHG